MITLWPRQKKQNDPLTRIYDTIFSYADKDNARRLVFERHVANEPVELEGIPTVMAETGTIVLSYYQDEKRMLSFSDELSESIINGLKDYAANGWHITFEGSEFGPKAIATRLQNHSQNN